MLIILNFISLQLHLTFKFHSLIVDAEQCADSVVRWVSGNTNRLKLNDDKIEALLVGSHRRVCVSQDNHLRVGNHDISF